jgi:hypothetical protein
MKIGSCDKLMQGKKDTWRDKKNKGILLRKKIKHLTWKVLVMN